MCIAKTEIVFFSFQKKLTKYCMIVKVSLLNMYQIYPMKCCFRRDLNDISSSKYNTISHLIVYFCTKLKQMNL